MRTFTVSQVLHKQYVYKVCGVCGRVWACVGVCGRVWACVGVCGRVWACVGVCAWRVICVPDIGHSESIVEIEHSGAGQSRWYGNGVLILGEYHVPYDYTEQVLRPHPFYRPVDEL